MREGRQQGTHKMLFPVIPGLRRIVPGEKKDQFVLGVFLIPSPQNLELESIRVASVEVQWQRQEIELKK